jgi:protease IV
MRMYRVFILCALVLAASACATPKIRLFPGPAEPLQEFTLQGKAEQKILMIPIRGIISDAPRETTFRTRPSMVQEIVSQLRKAEKDSNIKAILLQIDSPGGSVTASDVLYNEFAAFKKRTGVTIVAAMMDVAASGGYYVALPSDAIVAHPTTVTGSVGVLFLRPKVTGLMEKIGFSVEVNKSGKDKDMGSPFRPATPEEEKILQNLTDQLGRRFLELVAKHRGLDARTVQEISSARVYLADDALRLGLVDQIGYLDDAIALARTRAGLPADAKVVVYRRTEYPDDNIYNTFINQEGSGGISLFSLEQLGLPAEMTSGFYYLWPVAVAGH